jgi:hypothetical protein
MSTNDANSLNAAIGAISNPYLEYAVWPGCRYLPKRSVNITLQGVEFEITPSRYIKRGVAGWEEYCVSSFVGINPYLPIWLVGTGFVI